MSYIYFISAALPLNENNSVQGIRVFIHMRMVHFIALSLYQNIWRWMIALMNNELDKLWKEAVVA
jgi:hypothetical protein